MTNVSMPARIGGEATDGDFKTRNVICVPIYVEDDRETAEGVVGVIQARNKRGGDFTDRDAHFLKTLGTQASIALQNGMVYDLAVAAQKRVHALMDLINAMYSMNEQDLNANSLMFTVTRRMNDIVDSDRCTLYLADHQSKELWSMQGDINIQIPIDHGLVGACATAGEIVNVQDAYADDRFDSTFDEKSGYKTRSMLCVPMMHHAEGRLLGVLQLINKNALEDDGVFTQHDERFCDVICKSCVACFERTGVARRKTTELAHLEVAPGIEKAVEDLDANALSSGRETPQNAMAPLTEEDEQGLEVNSNGKDLEVVPEQDDEK